MITKMSQYAIVCDFCGDSEPFDGYSKRDAVANFRKDGWSIGRNHRCPKCVKKGLKREGK